MAFAPGDIPVYADDGNPVCYGRINGGNHVSISPADNHQTGDLALNRIVDLLYIGLGIGIIGFCYRYFDVEMFSQAQQYRMGGPSEIRSVVHPGNPYIFFHLLNPYGVSNAPYPGVFGPEKDTRPAAGGKDGNPAQKY